MHKIQKFHPIPQRGNYQENGPLPQTLGRIVQKICRDGEQKKQQQHWETRRNYPILRNKQIQNVYKKSKNTKYIYIYIQSLQGHSLGFDDLILFLNLLNEL